MKVTINNGQFDLSFKIAVKDEDELELSELIENLLWDRGLQYCDHCDTWKDSDDLGEDDLQGCICKECAARQQEIEAENAQLDSRHWDRD